MKIFILQNGIICYSDCFRKLSYETRLAFKGEVCGVKGWFVANPIGIVEQVTEEQYNKAIKE